VFDCGGGLYTVECGGGSWETEVSWDLVFEGAIIASGIVGSYELDLANGDYTLNMFDSFGDGWNGNAWNLYNEGTLVASCTLDTGTEGSCEFSLTGVALFDEVLPVETIDNAPDNKPAEISNRSNEDPDNSNENSRIEGFNVYRGNNLIFQLVYYLEHYQ
jgi:hypothetical protein